MNCCQDNTGKRPCPLCQNPSRTVDTKTIKHHLEKPWQWQEMGQGYYFCASPTCDAVYFDPAGRIIRQNALRRPIGLKSADPDTLLCYCFNISKRAAADNPALRDYVIAQTKSSTCSCETHNPSGRCCLENFQK